MKGMVEIINPGDIEVLGHGGGTAGFRSFVGYLPAQDITIVVAMTNMESDPSQVLFPALEILIPEFAPARQ